jgi:cyclopropane fatty-acyl-phospholipid synthase-like methyltransferase
MKGLSASSETSPQSASVERKIMKHAEEKHFQEGHYASEATRILRSELMQRRRDRIIDVLITACECSKSARILSLGCGNGETEITAAPHFAHITGLDLSETAIEQAMLRAGTAGISNTSFVVGDCTELDELDFEVPFDTVWALGFLHHISDDEMRSLIRNVYQVLAPGGVCALVLGDVRKGKNDPINVAEVVAKHLKRKRSRFQLAQIIEDAIPENRKVTKIWGEKKRGRATAIDRVLVLYKDRYEELTEHVAW